MNFSELKKRVIFKVGCAYLAGSWLVIQLIGTLSPIYDWPGILVRGFAFMLIMGYPFVMLMTLAYEMLHKTRDWQVTEAQNLKNAGSGNIFYSVIIAIVILTFAIMLVDIFVLRPGYSRPVEGQSDVGVLIEKARESTITEVSRAQNATESGNEQRVDVNDNAPVPANQLISDANRLRNDGQFFEAEKYYQRYFYQYGYTNADAMQAYAHLLSRTGQFNEAIAMFERARQQEPMATRFSYEIALHELYRGKVEAAREIAELGQPHDGGEFLVSAVAWEIAMRNGDTMQAARLIRNFYKNSDQDKNAARISRRFMEKMADILAINDLSQASEDIIALIKDPLVTQSEMDYVAKLAALMGQPEIALDYWFGEMASPAIWDGVYDDMRRLPDFNQLVQEKGLVDYWRATGNWGDFCVAAGGRDFVCK